MYRYVVTNNGTSTLHAVGVTDTLVSSSDLSCAQTTIAPGAGTACTGTYVVSQADVDAGSVASSATVTALDAHGATVSSGAAGALVTAQTQSAMAISASSTSAGYSLAGDAIDYTYTVTNTGQTTLHSVAVSDDHVVAPGPDCPPATLSPSVSVTCTGSYTVTQADVDAGTVTAVSGASALDPHGASVTSAGAQVTVTGSSPSSLTVAASSPTTDFAAAGDQIAYQYLVTNTGATTLHSVTVTDGRPSVTPTCPQTTLAPGASSTCTATVHVTQANVDAGTITERASAAGTSPQGISVFSAQSDAVTVTGHSTASLVLAALALSGRFGSAGDVLAYRYSVTNTGQTTVHALAISDDQVSGSDVSCPSLTLAPGASVTCTGVHTVSQADRDAGSVTATITASAADPSNAPVESDSAQITVSAGQASSLGLAVVPQTPIYAAAGDQIAVDFHVTNTGQTTVHALAITDPQIAPGDLSCSSATLAPGDSETCTGSYPVTQADVDAGGVTISAVAGGLDPQGVSISSAAAQGRVTASPPSSLAIELSTPPAGLPPRVTRWHSATGSKTPVRPLCTRFWSVTTAQPPA